MFVNFAGCIVMSWLSYWLEVESQVGSDDCNVDQANNKLMLLFGQIAEDVHTLKHKHKKAYYLQQQRKVCENQGSKDHYG